MDKIKDVFTGDRVLYVQSAITAYNRRDIETLRDLVTMFIIETKIIAAMKVDPRIADMDCSIETIESIVSAVEEVVSDTEIDLDYLRVCFSVFLTEAIIQYEINKILARGSTDIEYAIEASSMDIDEIDEKYRMRYLRDLISVLNIFDLSFDHYNDIRNANTR